MADALKLCAEKKQLTRFQGTERNGNANPMATYLLPYVLGLLVGGGLVLLCYLGCWGGLGACWDREVQVLVQVAADPKLYQTEAATHNLDVLSQQDSRNSVHRLHRDKIHMVSLLPGCPNRPLHLFVMVLSAPGASLRRMAIRGTWGHHYRPNAVKVTTRFLVGTLQLEEDKIAALKVEQEMFKDLLLLKDLKDSYRNLTTKVLTGMQWANQNLVFDYLVKVDDDTYVRLEAISDALRKLNCDKHLYWGYFMGYAFPELSGKWEELKWFHCPHYLPYAMGGGYILSERTVKLLACYSNRLILYSNEDVSVASWLTPYRLNRKHDLRFDSESVSHGCNNGYLISHKERVRSFYSKYSSLISNGTLCAPREREEQPAYIYNWTSSPLDCCKRVKGLPVV